MVPGSGPLTAKLTIIGEAPGAEEERLQRPFVGASGHLLDRVLRAAGLRREETYITNLYKSRPPNNDISTVPKAQLEFARRDLRFELAELDSCRLLVPVGNKALWAVADVEGITKRRGAPIRCWDGRIAIPTIHPAATFRQDSWTPSIYLDFQRAAQALAMLESNVAVIPQRKLLIAPTVEELREFIGTIGPADPLSFDIETQPGRVICVGLSRDPSCAVSVLLNSPEVVHLVDTVLADPTVPKVGQNVMYDVLMLERCLGIAVQGIVADTMLLHGVLEPELPHGLDFLNSMYCWEPYYKDEAKGWSARQALDQLLVYNCKDAAVTLECFQEMMKDLREQPALADLFYQHTMRLWHALRYMTQRGVRCDLVAKSGYAAMLSAAIVDRQAVIDTAVGRPLNVNSSKQLHGYFVEERRLAVPQSRFTHQASFDDDALAQLELKYPREPLFRQLREQRATKKLLSTYANAVVDSDGRLRCFYNMNTKTGRLSSRQTPWGTGLNLQNVPTAATDSAARRMFIPDEGCIFIQGDYRQAEARVVAYLAGCKSMLAVFTAGGDLHRRMAATIFKKPPESISKPERELAKRVVHAANYGMGKKKLALLASISEDDAADVLLSYFATFPEIAVWQAETVHTVRRTGHLSTPFGRSRRFYGRLEDTNCILAYLPQSVVADLTNRALLRAWVHGLDVRLQIHDAILVNSLTNELEADAAILKEVMEEPFELDGQAVVIPAELKSGPSWGDLEKCHD